MTKLFAQPYDVSATGFYFESADDYTEKSANLTNDYGNSVEEFEIQFIDGASIDADLAKAWSIHQGSIAQFFDVVDSWDEHEKQVFIIAVGECGCSFDPTTVHPDDFDVDIYHMDSMRELAEHFVEEGMYGEIPQQLTYYIDYDAMARDLSVDYSETTIGGDTIIYACR